MRIFVIFTHNVKLKEEARENLFLTKRRNKEKQNRSRGAEIYNYISLVALLNEQLK